METIKGIVCDLDGTLLTDKKDISPKTLAALLEVQAKGIKVILASSRGYFMVEEFVDLLKLKQYGGCLVCHNGITAMDLAKDKTFTVEGAGIKPEVANRLFEYGKAHRHLMVFESEKGVQLLVPLGLRWASPYLAYLRVKKKYKEMRKLTFRLFGDFRFSPDQKLETVRHQKDLFHPISKAGFIRLLPNVDKVIQNMQNVFEEDLDFVRISRFWCDIMPKGVNKASGIGLLEESLGFSLDQCMAFGDSNNDVELLGAAKIGIAMGNALPICKEVSDDVTLSNNRDGIYLSLKKYGLVD